MKIDQTAAVIIVLILIAVVIYWPKQECWDGTTVYTPQKCPPQPTTTVTTLQTQKLDKTFMPVQPQPEAPTTSTSTTTVTIIPTTSTIIMGATTTIWVRKTTTTQSGPAPEDKPPVVDKPPEPSPDYYIPTPPTWPPQYYEQQKMTDAVLKKDPSLCPALGSKEDLCYYYIVKNGGDPGICARITNSGTKKDCYEYLASQGDASACEQSWNPGLCKAKLTMDPQECLKLGENDKNICLYYIVEQTKDPAICELFDEMRKQECLEQYKT